MHRSRKFSSMHEVECNSQSSTDLSRGRSTRALVEEQIRAGNLQEDPHQLDLASRLDELRVQLCRSDQHVISSNKLTMDMFSDSRPGSIVDFINSYWKAVSFRLRRTLSFSKVSPPGMYIHGSVGVGKSFLMNLFVQTLQHNDSSLIHRRKIRRAHFHEFMLDVHDRIHKFKLKHRKGDPLPAVALSIAQEARILCLDEFQVTDIADAMILKRLLGMLWDTNHNVGMVVVATSNRDPIDLYEGGLNRSLFLPFIDTLQRNMNVVDMSGDTDYRRETPGNNDDHQMQKSYFWPVDCPHTRDGLECIFAQGGGYEHDGSTDHAEYNANTKIPVRMGRQVTVPRSNGTCAWFDFDDLCNRPLGAADYLAICESYQVLIVDHVPQLDASKFNQARRFITLIDALYESKTRLVLASKVPLEKLLVHFETTVESHDGDEEIAVEGLASNHNKSFSKDLYDNRNPSNVLKGEMFVKREGGSSSSAATTMIRTQDGEVVEWSATGRIGVALAQLSAVRDVSFSFARAESRLVEMNNGRWGLKRKASGRTVSPS